jgi:long-chain acyl-CoA synthetase
LDSTELRVSMALESYHFPTLLKRNYERWGNRKVAVRQKIFGLWQKYTWEDCYQQIKWRSLGLISLGLQRGDKVSIIGDNEPEWLWFQAAVQAAGGVPVGLFADSLPPEVKFIVDHSSSKFVVAGDQEQVDKMLNINDELPNLSHVIYWNPDGMRNYRNDLLISEGEVMERGKDYEKQHPEAFEKEISKGSEDDLAGLFCTSGTTSKPKLTKFSYKSLSRQAEALYESGVVKEDDNVIAFFPLGLTSTDLVSVISHLVAGVTMNYPERPETAMEDLREISPEVIIMGPRHYESLVRLIQARIAGAGLIQRTFYRLFLPVGYKMAEFRIRNKQPNLFWRALHKIAWCAVLRPIIARISLLKTRVAIGGSALLSPETYWLPLALGLNLRIPYGSAETGLVTLHREDDMRAETAGRPLPGMELRIDDQGEILVGGDYTLAGYHNNPEAEAASTKDGWFHSGDAGYLNEDGHLIIAGPGNGV